MKIKTTPKTKGFFSTYELCVIGICAALSVALYQLEIPFFPPFLKFNLADIPAILAGLFISPIAGIAVEFVRCLVHTFVPGTSTVYVGESIDFILGTLFVLAFCLPHKIGITKKIAKPTTKISAFTGDCAIGAIFSLITLVGIGFVINYFGYGLLMSIVAPKAPVTESGRIAWAKTTLLLNIIRPSINATVAYMLSAPLRKPLKMILKHSAQ